MRRMTQRVLVGLVVCAVSAGAPRWANAQQQPGEESTAEPSPDQVRLNQAAVEAIRAEDYDKAAGLLEASLELGQLNVTYLNLGRAYQKLGKCAEAKQAYLAVVSAPAVEAPPPSLIDAKAEQYLAELQEQCAAQKEQNVGGEVVDADDNDPSGDDAVYVEPAPPAESSSAPGWTATIGGGVLLGTSAVLYVLGEQEYEAVRSGLNHSTRAQDGAVTTITRQEALQRQERGDLLNTLALSGAVVGAASVGLGVYWLVADGSEQAESSVRLSPGVDRLSVEFSTRF